MGPVSRCSSRGALVSATFPRLIALTHVRVARPIACKFLVFLGRPAGRLALFCYLCSWFSVDLGAALVWMSLCPWSHEEDLLKSRFCQSVFGAHLMSSTSYAITNAAKLDLYVALQASGWRLGVALQLDYAAAVVCHTVFLLHLSCMP